jgi:hypothetical protein
VDAAVASGIAWSYRCAARQRLGVPIGEGVGDLGIEPSTSAGELRGGAVQTRRAASAGHRGGDRAEPAGVDARRDDPAEVLETGDELGQAREHVGARADHGAGCSKPLAREVAVALLRAERVFDVAAVDLRDVCAVAERPPGARSPMLLFRGCRLQSGNERDSLGSGQSVSGTVR